MSTRYGKTAFVVICRDGPNGAVVRAVHTAEHLAYIETVMDELNVAGPLHRRQDLVRQSAAPDGPSYMIGPGRRADGAGRHLQ